MFCPICSEEMVKGTVDNSFTDDLPIIWYPDGSVSNEGIIKSLVSRFKCKEDKQFLLERTEAELTAWYCPHCRKLMLLFDEMRVE